MHALHAVQSDSSACMQVGGLLPTLERIYSAPLILHQVMLDEGLSNLGDTRRLERAMHKLVTGVPYDALGYLCRLDSRAIAEQTSPLLM